MSGARQSRMDPQGPSSSSSRSRPLSGTAHAEPALGEPITSRASVIDGNTIDVQNQRIRLHGIDAPEISQRCRRAFGFVEYRCRKEAAFALANRIGARPVTCEVRDVDR